MMPFELLLGYYKECFSLIDCIHFNSDVTRQEYEKSLSISKNIGKVVAITHGGITDNRKIKSFSHDKLQIGFIGNYTPYKGLPLLKEVLSQITDGWNLNIWGCNRGKDTSEVITYCGKFSKNDLPMVYDSMDLLIVPSIWKETFSLVTLEALSFGVPVLLSDNVGAQNIVREYAPDFIFHSKSELTTILRKLINDRQPLKNYNEKICSLPWDYGMKEHAQKIIDDIYR